jgi:arylsulfatase A-like enzyme
VQVYHGGGGWDAHGKLKQNHANNCAAVDAPIAGLLADLEQRGLLDETVVVWATEFGRTPGAENADGRDHHHYGFSVWLAGGGIKGGIVHGATDEIGFHAVEDRHCVTDIHATVLHQLGLDPRRMEVPGHKRLEMDFGRPIKEIIAQAADRPGRAAGRGCRKPLLHPKKKRGVARRHASSLWERPKDRPA